MVLQKYGLLGFKEVKYFFGRQGRGIDTCRMGWLEGLHQGDLLFDTLLTDVAGLFWIEPSFVGEQFDVTLTDNTFGILLVPLFGCREEQVKVKRVYLLCISKVRFKTFNEIVPKQ